MKLEKLGHNIYTHTYSQLSEEEEKILSCHIWGYFTISKGKIAVLV